MSRAQLAAEAETFIRYSVRRTGTFPLFAYGSLALVSDYKKTTGGVPAASRPCRVDGVRREFVVAADPLESRKATTFYTPRFRPGKIAGQPADEFMMSLGLVETAGGQCHAIVHEVPPGHMPSLRERERNYTPLIVSAYDFERQGRIKAITFMPKPSSSLEEKLKIEPGRGSGVRVGYFKKLLEAVQKVPFGYAGFSNMLAAVRADTILPQADQVAMLPLGYESIAEHAELYPKFSREHMLATSTPTPTLTLG